MENHLNSFLNEKAIDLEKQRKKAIKYNQLFKLVKPLSAVLNVLFVILVLLEFIIPILLPILIIVGVIAFLLTLIKDPKKVFENKLKNQVLPEIFKNINPTFNYSSVGYDDKILQESELLSKGFFKNTFKIKGEDYVTGKIKNVDVAFFEIQFYKEMINYKKQALGCLFSLLSLPFLFIKNIFMGTENSEPDEIELYKDINIFFSGFFMYADFHKDFNGKVLMIPKKNERIKDRINEILEPKNLNKINVENPYIDSHYNIYSSNPQMGYYLLSQSLIDRIHIMSEKEKALPIISLINGKMYFLMPWNKNFFKIDLFSKIESGDYFSPYIKEIESFEKIIQDLNLNTRIWSKI